MASRREITKMFAREYAKADKAHKGRLLDELVHATGWTRDHARRAIRVANARPGPARDRQRRPRPRKYSYDALKPHKDAVYPNAVSGTKPSHILRSAIPTRTNMDDPLARPGFLELDTVAHCGHALKGEFLRTLTATDPVTGWTLLRSIRNNAFIHVHGALEWITKHTPVPIAGVDFDNGSEFMNWGVIAWCDNRDIPVTRSRPYKHNDNAHVEQRNGDWVRKHAFRYRYETETELALLNGLRTLVMARKNHLLPCVKAVDWTHTGSVRKKRIYDKPRTPYQRLLDSGTLDERPVPASNLSMRP